MKQLNFLEHCSDPTNPGEIKARWRLYIDGASRNNPGPAGVGVFVLKEEQVFYAHGFFVGTKTNNEAEYIALLLGVFICKSAMNVGDLLYIASDSQLVIKQLLGEFRVTKPTIRVLYDAAQVMLKDINYSLCHIRREFNARADELANIGIDKKNNLPHDFVRYVHAHNIVL